MFSRRILRRLAFVAAAGALTIATSQARTFIPTTPEPAAPQAASSESRPVTRPARPAQKKFAMAEPASCQTLRKKLFVDGEGWIVRSIGRCASSA
jgi:hypothetical protein